MRSGGQHSDHEFQYVFFVVVAAAAVTRGAFFSVRTDRTGRKSSNRRFIEALGAQNTVNTDVCCTSKPKRTVFTRCLPLVTKIAVITVFFGQCLAKTPVFTHF